MDDSRTVTLSTTALADIDVWLGRPRPSLVVRCLEGKTSLYVVTESAAQPELGKYESHQVTIRLDRQGAGTQDWTSSTDSRALFAPDPIALARLLSRTDTFRFRFTPFNSTPAIATFATRGLRQHLQQLATACDWTIGESRLGPVAVPSFIPGSDTAVAWHGALLRRYVGRYVALEGYSVRGKDAPMLDSVSMAGGSFSLDGVLHPISAINSARVEDGILILVFKKKP